MSHDSEEREALLELLKENVREQRRARRWRLFTRGAVIAVVVLAVFYAGTLDLGVEEEIGPHTAEVRIDGPIMADTAASSEQVIKGLERAFDAEGAEGVVLRINSPGGSPVHARQIYEEVMRLRGEHEDTPVHAVIEDMGTSGAYYVAAAADRIHVSEASVVGSIGVIMGSFGADEALERLGIERRVYSAGEDKAFLDPFAPEDPEHVEHLQGLLDDIHEQFISAVREGRGDRLNEATIEEERLFSGLIWTGRQSLELGLADEIGSVRSVARDVIGEDEVVDYTARRDVLARLADRLGASFGQGVEEALYRAAQQPR